MKFINSLLRKSYSKPPYNILTYSTHESYSVNLAKTGHNFYLLEGGELNTWKTKYRQVPENISIFNVNEEFPLDIDFDFILSQQKFGQIQRSLRLAEILHLPIINIEHTLPMPNWPKDYVQNLKNLKGDVNLFISEFSRKEWGWGPLEAGVIHHGIDTNTFSPDNNIQKQRHILAVVNDWVNRDWCMPANQKILTSNGWKNIQEITTSDSVLTDNGKYERVINTFQRQYSGEMIDIKFKNGILASFTPEHKIRVYRENQNEQWQYISANRIKAGDILRFPSHIATDFTCTDTKLAWLIGLIVGDGHITKNGTIQISFKNTPEDKDMAEFTSKILQNITRNKTYLTKIKDNHFVLECSSKIFGNWLRDKIYDKDKKKVLPDFIINSTNEIRSWAICGAWYADGSFKNGKNHCTRFCYSTNSWKLASQIHSIIQSCGIKCSINTENRITNKSNQEHKIIYRVVGYGKKNVEKFNTLILSSDKQDFKYEGYEYIVQESSIRHYNDMVYNCEVNNDPSYVVYPGFVSHNCCNFQGWQRITRDLPVKVLGDTPGLSLPAKDINELVRSYREAQVFINTATVSPIPTVMLEAMACLPGEEVVFLDTIPMNIEELVRYETLHQTTLFNKIHKKHIVSNYNGELISVKCNHIPPFRVTEDHKIAIATFTKKYNSVLRKQHKKPYDIHLNKIEYKKAGELQLKDWVVIPKPKFETKTLNISKEWLRFYGLYLAEGSAHGGYIDFTFHEKELNYIKEVKNIALSLGKIANIRSIPNEKATKISFYDGYLCKQLLHMFGHESHNKQIPKEFFSASNKELETFLFAYLDVDGYITKNGGYSYSTVSKTLAYQSFLLFMKLGYLPNWHYSGPRKAIIKGREFNCRGKYQISFTPKRENSIKLYQEDQDNFYVRVKEITTIAYSGEVYNLTTESHSYNIPFALTHNCGNAVVTIDACMCPEIIQHNVNGMISKDENELRKYCQILLDHPETCKRLGEAARQTILEKFSLDNFITKWNKVFDYANELTYAM